MLDGPGEALWVRTPGNSLSEDKHVTTRGSQNTDFLRRPCAAHRPRRGFHRRRAAS